MNTTIQDITYEFNTLLLSLQRQESNFQETLKTSDPFLTYDLIHKMDRIMEKEMDICIQLDEKINEKMDEIKQKSRLLFPIHAFLVTLNDLVDYSTEYDDLDEKKILLFELIGIQRELFVRRKRIETSKEDFDRYRNYEIYELYDYFVVWKILLIECIFYFRLSEKYIKLSDMLIRL